MGVTVPCALNFNINPAHQANLRAADIKTVMTAIRGSNQVTDAGIPVVDDPVIQRQIERWLKSGALISSLGSLPAGHLRSGSTLNIGYEKRDSHTWTSTELLPDLLKHIGLSQQETQLARILRTIQKNREKQPNSPRYDLTEICQQAFGPSFEAWFLRLPNCSPRNLELLQNFFELLIQRGIIEPSQRDFTLRPIRKAVP